MELLRKCLLVVLALCLTEAVLGQHATFNIRGTITDNKGKGIELATVSLNQSLVTSSSAGGKFLLKNVPAGTYTYRVSFVGYETATGTFVVKTGRETLDVSLNELGLQLQNVTVTAKQVQMGRSRSSTRTPSVISNRRVSATCCSSYRATSSRIPT